VIQFRLASITDLPACFALAKADVIDANTFALGGNVVNLVKVENEALGQVLPDSFLVMGG